MTHKKSISVRRDGITADRYQLKITKKWVTITNSSDSWPMDDNIYIPIDTFNALIDWYLSLQDTKENK